MSQIKIFVIQGNFNKCTGYLEFSREGVSSSNMRLTISLKSGRFMVGRVYLINNKQFLVTAERISGSASSYIENYNNVEVSYNSSIHNVYKFHCRI